MMQQQQTEKRTGSSLDRRDVAIENANSIIDSYTTYQNMRGGGVGGGGFTSVVSSRENMPSSNSFHSNNNNGMTTNTSSQVPLTRKLPMPMRTKDTMERSQTDLQMFLSQTQRQYNQDEFVSTALTTNLQELSDVTKCAEYSESVRLRQYKGFVPFYITNVAQSYQTLEILYKPVQGGFTQTYHEVPPYAFLSCRDYAQRAEPECPLDIESTPKGNLKNCMMVTVSISDIVNTTDMYAAVTLCHEVQPDNYLKKKAYNIWGNREYTVDKAKLPSIPGVSDKDPRVHWVIPPKSNSSKEFCIYKSGFEVNNPLIARYPEFDGTVAWLLSPKSGTETTYGDRTVYTAPAHHPLVEWLFKNAAFYPGSLSLPMYKPSDSSQVPMYQISENDFLAAAHEYCNEFNLSVPVVDLNNMRVCVQWLDPADKSTMMLDNMERAIKELEYKDSRTAMKIKDYYDCSGGLSFRMSTEHIFRDQYKEITPSG